MVRLVGEIDSSAKVFVGILSVWLQAVDENEYELRSHVERIEAIEEELFHKANAQSEQVQQLTEQLERLAQSHREQLEQLERRHQDEVRGRADEVTGARLFVAEKLRRVADLEQEVRQRDDRLQAQALEHERRLRDQLEQHERHQQNRLDQQQNEQAERVEELEEALRESVRITADRELALDAETKHRVQLADRVRLSLFKQSQFRNGFGTTPSEWSLNDPSRIGVNR